MMAVHRLHSLARTARELRRDRGGMALVEFALSLPFVVFVTMTGAELANFTTAKMRVSQIALHVADNAARIGTGTVLSNKTISEAQINDLFTGANYQGGRLNVKTNGKVILSSLENDPSNTGKYYIHWQRCYGSKTYASSYGKQGDNNLTGMGPTGQKVTAPSGGATMFVEISYNYQPIISTKFMPMSTITEIAAMTVRDSRDLTQIYNSEGVTASSCP